jgi:uncharacterized membrane protein
MTGTELALVITAACTGVATVLTSIGGFIVLLYKINAVHDLTNSLADRAEAGARATGNLQGRIEQTAERRTEAQKEAP